MTRLRQHLDFRVFRIVSATATGEFFTGADNPARCTHVSLGGRRQYSLAVKPGLILFKPR